MVKRIALFFLLSVLLAGSAVAQSPCSAPPQSQLYYWGSPNIQIDDRADHVGQFIIEGFAFWAWGPLPQRGWCGQMINSLSQITVDLHTVGMNGIDVNPNGIGNMPPDGAYDVHLWAITGNPNATPPVPDTVAAVVSLQGSSVFVPHDSAYTLYRKMPYNIIVKNGVIVPSTVLGWPTPCIFFTNTDVDPHNMVVATYPAATNAWSPVDVSKVNGENANFGHWRAMISGGTASVWISPSNVSPGNTFFKTLAQNNTGPTLSMPMRTTSDHPELGQPAMIYVWTGNYVPAPGSTGVVVQIIEDAECVTEQTD